MRGQAFFGRRNWDILPPQGDETARTREEDALSVVAVMARDEGGNSAERMTGRRLALGSAVVLLLLAALMTVLLLQGVDRQVKDVTSTYAVRDAARQLASTLSQAEASQRGFLLTSDVRFLGPYEQAVAEIGPKVALLEQMTAGDPGQAARVASITADLAAKQAEMARAVELVAAQREAEAQTLTETGMGARLMADVTATLNAFIAEENQKLELRNRDIDNSRVGFVAALALALSGAGILATTLLTSTQRQVSVLSQRQRGLVTQNEALELEVAERTRAIEDARMRADAERQRVEALLQDANHRIGNSLATVSSLLALQVLRSRSEEVRTALEAARLRVHAIASAHRRLRLGSDLESASADELLKAVLDDIETTQVEKDRIRILGEIAPITMGARDATTMGILVAELVTNALKHAFPDGRPGTIVVRLELGVDGVPMLSVSDDGVGQAEIAETAGSGLGAVIVRQLAGQFGGEPIYKNRPEGGLRVTVAMPLLASGSGDPSASIKE